MANLWQIYANCRKFKKLSLLVRLFFIFACLRKNTQFKLKFANKRVCWLLNGIYGESKRIFIDE